LRNFAATEQLKTNPSAEAWLNQTKEKTMNHDSWEDLKEEVCTYLEIGASIGETELETMTRLIWTERQNNSDAIEEPVTAVGRNGEPGPLSTEKNKVLQWKTGLPSPSFKPRRPNSATLTVQERAMLIDCAGPASEHGQRSPSRPSASLRRTMQKSSPFLEPGLSLDRSLRRSECDVKMRGKNRVQSEGQ
jgi:hypothetical protein